MRRRRDYSREKWILSMGRTSLSYSIGGINAGGGPQVVVVSPERLLPTLLVCGLPTSPVCGGSSWVRVVSREILVFLSSTVCGGGRVVAEPYGL